jgi:hypothetical protein
MLPEKPERRRTKCGGGSELADRGKTFLLGTALDDRTPTLGSALADLY